MTEKIVLDVNLKFILDSLNLVQRGELLTALFDKDFQCADNTVKNVYRYIATLQDNVEIRRQKMKKLSVKAVAARLKKEPTADRAVDRTVDRNLQRKETKEILNNNNLNLFSFEQENDFKTKKQEKFIKPDVEEVRAFIDAHKLCVDAQKFVDFYEARGWKIGSVAIENWQAVLRLWHTRADEYAQKKPQKTVDDEKYWHELAEKFSKPPEKQISLPDFSQKSTDILEEKKSVGILRQLSLEQRENADVNLNEQPFTRFMHRIEKFDIQTENDHDRK